MPGGSSAAMDQRGSLKKALAKEKGGEVGDKDMEEFKIHVTEVLTKHATAILLDPEWGLPASKRRASGSNSSALALVAAVGAAAAVASASASASASDS